MTSTLPAPRDLPPHSHARIRAELLRATGRRRTRLAPLIAGFAAVAAVGTAVAVVVVPSQPESAGQAPPAASARLPVSSSPLPLPTPTFPGLPDQERAAIEAGCAKAASQPSATLYNLTTDDAGKVALLIHAHVTMDCSIGQPGMAYNSGSSGAQMDGGADSAVWRHWLPGDLSRDINSGSAGGSAPGGKAEYRGQPGYITAAGRISNRVTRVTFTEGTRTVDAHIANGTYIARIVYPATWAELGNSTGGVVRAYDANGTLLGETGRGEDKHCYVIPDGRVLNRDPKGNETCLPATPWR